MLGSRFGGLVAPVIGPPPADDVAAVLPLVEPPAFGSPMPTKPGSGVVPLPSEPPRTVPRAFPFLVPLASCARPERPAFPVDRGLELGDDVAPDGQSPNE